MLGQFFATQGQKVLRRREWTLGQTVQMAADIRSFQRANSLTASEQHVRSKLSVIRRFLQFAKIPAWEKWTAKATQHYIVWLAQQGKAPRTAQSHYSALASFARYLQDIERITHNPCKHIRLPRMEKRLPIFLTVAESEQALEIAREHGIYAEVCLALNTGLRVGEMRRLMWDDVDFDLRCLYVRKSKSRCPRKVCLNQKALGALYEQQRKAGRWPHVFPGGRPCVKRNPKGCWNRNRPRSFDWWIRKALVPLQAEIPKFNQLPKGSVGRGWHLFSQGVRG